jgi:hypothetical protein
MTGVSSLSVAAVLPESATPYVVLTCIGFFVAIWGHGMHAKWVVATGIILIFLSVLLFPIALKVFSGEDTPPRDKNPFGILTPLATQAPVGIGSAPWGDSTNST